MAVAKTIWASNVAMILGVEYTEAISFVKGTGAPHRAFVAALSEVAL